MKRILCIWLPNWPVQRLVVAQPALRDSTLLLHVRDPRRGLCVAACSRRARRSGVRLGMPLAEATALVRAGEPAPLHVEAHDAEGDEKQLKQLAAWCEQFSPLVGLEACDPSVPSLGPECLLLDVSGLAPLFGSEAALVERVRQAFAERGYVPRMALADTVGAAWAAAHCRPPAAPPGSQPWILPAGETRARIGELPVAAMRLVPETLHLLHQLGIESVEQLLVLPRGSFSARFGDHLLQRLDQALGIAPELIASHKAPPCYQAEWLLDPPVELRETIDFVLGQLIERIAGMLAQRQEGVLRLDCRFDCDAGRPLHMQVSLFRPTAQPRYLVDLMRMQLERLSLAHAVVRIGVQATLTAPLEHSQGELFADGEHATRQGLGALIDRLSSRLGSQAVLRGSLQPEAQPERAVRWRSWASRRSRRRRRRQNASAASPPPPAAAERPLILCSPPLPLQVIAVVPDGPPARFGYRDQTCSVVHHWGPERIETGWWRGRCVRRDYYRVEIETGQRLWLFRDLQDRAWFLHGEFT